MYTSETNLYIAEFHRNFQAKPEYTFVMADSATQALELCTQNNTPDCILEMIFVVTEGAILEDLLDSSDIIIADGKVSYTQAGITDLLVTASKMIYAFDWI